MHPTRFIFLIPLYLFIFSPHAYGQDTIHTKRNGKIVVKVVEIDNTNKTVLYKLKDNPNSIVHGLPFKDIDKIVFKSGLTRVITTSNKATSESKQDSDTKPEGLIKEKNMVSINAFELVFKNLSVSYERIVCFGYIGFKVPFTAGFLKDGTGGYLQMDKNLSSGCDLNIYPIGQEQSKVYFGPGFEFGNFFYRLPKSESVRNSDAEPLLISYYSWVFNFGVMTEISKDVSFSMHAGLGGRKNNYSDFYNYISVPDDKLFFAWTFGINFGYRF